MINIILTLVNVVSTVISIVVLSFLYFQHRSRIDGIQFWLACHILNMFGFAFSASRVLIPEYVAIMFANPLFALGFIMLFVGMGRFLSKPINMKPLWIVFAVYFLALSYFTFIDNNLNWRQFFLYVYEVIINLATAYFILKNKSKELGSIATFASFILFLTGFIFAIGMGLTLADTSIHTYLDDNLRDIMILTTIIFVTIMITYAEVMLITARLLDNVQVSERKFSLVFDNTQLPVFITRLSDGRIHEVNHSFERLFGYTSRELMGKTTLDIGLWEDIDQRQLMIDRTLKEQSVKDMEAVFLTKSGQKRVCQISCNLTRIQGEDYILNDIIDVTDSVHLREDLKRLATHDHLTGLANRSLFYDRFDQAKAAADRHHHQLSVIIMDMDKLKDINDSYGHLVGDKAIAYLAEKINAILRKTDTFARFGGDEFCIILNEMKNIEGTLFVLRKIGEALAEPLVLDGLQIKVQISMGIALYPADGTTINDLIKKADKALYTVKQDRGLGHRFYSELKA